MEFGKVKSHTFYVEIFDAWGYPVIYECPALKLYLFHHFKDVLGKFDKWEKPAEEVIEMCKRLFRYEDYEEWK